jgi:hypothetical protein
MRIFARTVICSWTNEMITRFARSASMIRARRYDSGGSAAAGRRLIPIRSDRYHPTFGRIDIPHYSALSCDRRFQRSSESAYTQSPSIVKSYDLSHYRDSQSRQ